MNKKIKFLNHNGEDFLSAVRRKVDAYFKEIKGGRNATWQHHAKVVGFVLLWTGLYGTILMQQVSPYILLMLAMALGIVTGAIGVNLCHDAAHGSYFKSARWNKIFGYSYDLIGFSSYVWRVTHNGGHHTFTNIFGLDPDIDKPVILRLAPQSPWLWFHAYQNWYIWFLYSLVSLNWVYVSDFVYFFKEERRPPLYEVVLFFFFKVIHFTLFLGIPLAYLSLPAWQILLGYLALQMTGGLVVALTFQLAHLVENVEFFSPDSQGIVHNQWGVHELLTTSNFGTHNRLLTHLLGGLNYQVEHHLFPHVAHSHYPAIAPFVRETAIKFNLPYHENKTMWTAVISHCRLLKKLGLNPVASK